MTSLRISISKKNKETGEYEQEYGGHVAAVGTAVAAKAAKLQPGDRIKLGDVDCCTKYVKEQQKECRNDYIVDLAGQSENDSFVFMFEKVCPKVPVPPGFWGRARIMV